MATNLAQRCLTAFLLLPVVILATWFNKPLPWLTLGAAIWGFLALFEFYNLVRKYDPAIRPLYFFGLIWSTIIIISPHLPEKNALSIVLTAGVVISLVWYIFKPVKEQAFTSWSWTTAGVLYVGLLLSYLVALRLLPDGAGWVFLALFATFASDTGAFFIGSLFGKRPLAPSISPRKTWAGAVGGVVGSMLMSPLVTWLFALPLGYLEAAGLGLLVSVFGQMGDLVESLFKRNMKAKDSGQAIPGHGGCLDRMDSVVIAAIVVYYYVLFVVG